MRINSVKNNILENPRTSVAEKQEELNHGYTQTTTDKELEQKISENPCPSVANKQSGLVK